MIFRIVGCLVGFAFACAATAQADTYEVKSCSASTAKRADAWALEIRPGTSLDADDWCVSGTSGSDGQVVFTASKFLRPPIPYPGPGTSTPLGRAARLVLNAPPSGTLEGITYHRRLQSIDPGWEVRLKADSLTIESCVLGSGNFECPDPYAGHFSAALPAATSVLELGTWCVATSCPYNPGPLYDFAAVIYSSVVTVEENVAPTPGGVGVSGTNGAGWLNAGATGALSGSDTLGLRRIEVVDASNGNAVVGTVTNSGCVDWSVLPCSEPTAGLGPGLSGNVAIGGLADGAHQLRARAVDGAGNSALGSPVSVKVDRTAPVAEPTTVSGPVAATSAAFTWGAPTGTQHAPITAGRLKVCTGPTAGSLTCTWTAGIGASGNTTVALGNDGDLTTVQVELTDEAGNVGLSPAVELRRDTSAPGAPSLAVRNGIGNRAVLDVGTGETDIAGYALRYCGPSGCTDSRRLPYGFIEVEAPPPGLYSAEVALVDAAGNVGPTTTATIDRTSPGSEPGPGPTTPPITRTPIKLTVSKPIRPGVKRVALRGTTQAGSTTSITVTVSGRPTGRKRAVTKRTTVKPASSGTWKVSAAVPLGVPRGRKLTITVKAAPTERFTAATATFTRRR